MRSLGFNTFEYVDENTVKVYTTQGEVFYISPESVEKIKEYTWSFHKKDRKYPVSKIKGKRVFLHNFLCPHPKGYVTDHIDGDTINNRMTNFRVITKVDNMLNKKQYRNSKYFRGVTYYKRDNVFVARIQVKNKPIFLGRFPDLDSAIEARVKAEKKYFGELRRDKSV